MLKAEWHLHGVFEPASAIEYLDRAKTVLKDQAVDVLVVTGLSGIVLGARLAAMMGIKLAVVRRPGEAQQNLSGAAHDVEGYLGGRWVFFDDCVESGTTQRRAKTTYMQACADAGEPEVCAGVYLYRSDTWYPGEVDAPAADRAVPF